MSQPSGGLRALFLDNVTLKLVSIVTALVIFWLVRGSEEAQRALFVDVVAVTPPATSPRMLTTELPTKVRVTLRGSRSIVHALRPETLAPLEIDLRSTPAEVFFDPEVFELPGGIDVVNVVPPSVSLAWAERSEREVQVVPRVRGEPDPGLELTGLVSEPTSITVRGPSNQLVSLDRIETETLALPSGPAGTYERSALLLLPAHIEPVGPRGVTVRFQLVPEVVERTFTRLEVAPLGVSVHELRPERVRVTVRGTPEVVRNLEPSSLVPFVDVTTLSPAGGAQPFPVQLRPLPAGVEVVAVQPAEVLAVPARARP